MDKEKLYDLQTSSHRARRRYIITRSHVENLTHSLSEKEFERFYYAYQVACVSWCDVGKEEGEGEEGEKDIENKGTYGEYWYCTLEDIENGKEITNTEMIRRWIYYRAFLESYVQRKHDAYSDSHGMERGKSEVFI